MRKNERANKSGVRDDEATSSLRNLLHIFISFDLCFKIAKAGYECTVYGIESSFEILFFTFFVPRHSAVIYSKRERLDQPRCVSRSSQLPVDKPHSEARRGCWEIADCKICIYEEEKKESLIGAYLILAQCYYTFLPTTRPYLGYRVRICMYIKGGCMLMYINANGNGEKGGWPDRWKLPFSRTEPTNQPPFQ